MSRLFLTVINKEKILEGLENKFVNSDKLVVFFNLQKK